MRNIDEWLCNLYIEVKTVELLDFRFHEERIQFLVPPKFLKEYEKQQKKAAQLKLEREANDSSGGDFQTTAADSRSLKSSDNSDSEEDVKDEYSSSDGSVDSDLGFESGFAEEREKQKYEDDSRVRHKDYKYCISRDDSYVPSEQVTRETSLRKVQFIFREIINDLGIQKGTFLSWLWTFALSFIVFELRMIVHYLG